MKRLLGLVFAASLLFFVSLCLCDSVSAQSSSSDAPVTATVPSSNITVDSQPPTTPILVRPVDATVTSDRHPEFVWKKSTDPNGNTIIYTVYLNNIATYLGISDLGNSSGVGYTARLENDEIKLLPSADLPEGVYTWYVTAEDLSGNRRSSATWLFTVDLTAPLIDLTQLESITDPDLTWSPRFDFAGPIELNFYLSTEPFADIFLTIVNEDGSTLTSLSSTSNQTGMYSFGKMLPLGLYTVLISSLDRANLTSSLPEFYLNIVPSGTVVSPYPGSLPPSSAPGKPTVIQTILSSLPATVAKVTSRPSLSVIILVLLALTIVLLLPFLWKSRYNLTILDNLGQPLTDAIIYHSRGQSSSTILNRPNSLGQLYIPHLGRLSTLTIRISSFTYVLSLSVNQSRYKLIIIS